MATSSRQQPTWLSPAEQQHAADLPQLRVYNSLTRDKRPFVPIDKKGKEITWYACGPTVYDDSHIGHARNYVTTDIIRRIMQHHFGYNVFFVMNITDVDDKIIVRGRQQHFLAEFKKAHPRVDEEVRQTTLEAWKAYVTKNLAKLSGLDPTQDGFASIAWTTYELNESIDLAGLGAGAEQAAKTMMHIKAVVAAAKALLTASTSLSSIQAEAYWPLVDQILLPYLEKQGDARPFEQDHTIFTDLTRQMEDSFFEDMDRLNVLRPDRLTRVTEYVPQIIEFVEKIEDKVFAYAVQDPDSQNSSVYFDIGNFEKSDGNSYARLEPQSRGNEALQADGEGSLTKGSNKRSKNDFAIWKGSKPGEPSWKSERWGGGRPGWHIECSVMASDVLGPHIDIHSGGIDLAFPHHDNELAQSEAYYCQGHQHQWINYFMHMGHLHISGAKMSKSLKNFITIKEALGSGDYTPRSMRVVFLLGTWKDTIEVTPDMRQQAQSWERDVSYFLLKALDRQNRPSAKKIGENGVTSSDSQSQLSQKLEDAKKAVDHALLDSFDTPRAMGIISALLSDFNTAETAHQLADEDMLEAARWITRLVTIFGLDPSGDLSDKQRIGWSGIDIPEASKSFVYPLSAMRDDVRKRARESPFDPQQLKALVEQYPAAATGQPANAIQYAEAYSQTRDDLQALIDNSSPAKDFLAWSDKLRDTTLWNLGIYLEDQDTTGRPALVSPLSVDKIRDREEKEAQTSAKAKQKELALREKAEKQKEKDEKAKVKPEDMFRTAEYSEWDEQGIPLKDKDGKEVTKSALKKLQKMRTVQEKAHTEWLSRQKPS